jgi:anti-repressor protein
MNELKLFNFENNQVRTLLINNEPWFVGKDVADILGYQNSSRDINRHVDEEDRQNYQNGTSEINNRGMTIINESGLYSLVLSSKD